jgi:hypothetical protein
MSGEIDYREFAGTPSPKSKYLSDSLTPWYGSWTSVAGTLGIAYDSLPVGDCLARLTHDTPNADSWIYFTFNDLQNIKDYQLEFWYRKGNASAINFDVLISRLGYNLSNGGLYKGIGAGTVSWSKASLSIDSIVNYQAGYLPGANYRDIIKIALGVISFHIYNVVAPQRLDIAGFNLRRL